MFSFPLTKIIALINFIDKGRKVIDCPSPSKYQAIELMNLGAQAANDPMKLDTTLVEKLSSMESRINAYFGESEPLELSGLITYDQLGYLDEGESTAEAPLSDNLNSSPVLPSGEGSEV